MLKTTPWLLQPFTLVLRTRTHTSLKSRVWLWHVPQLFSAATINYLSRTKKRMNDESKQHGAVDRT